jgi:hypothetical protein
LNQTIRSDKTLKPKPPFYKLKKKNEAEELGRKSATSSPRIKIEMIKRN